MQDGSVSEDTQQTNSHYFNNFPSCYIITLSSHIIIFSCCCSLLLCQRGKFQGHPGGESIMTGLLSAEEEAGAESQ